jgi:hypothetical protein
MPEEKGDFLHEALTRNINQYCNLRYICATIKTSGLNCFEHILRASLCTSEQNTVRIGSSFSKIDENSYCLLTLIKEICTRLRGWSVQWWGKQTGLFKRYLLNIS